MWPGNAFACSDVDDGPSHAASTDQQRQQEEQQEDEEEEGPRSRERQRRTRGGSVTVAPLAWGDGDGDGDVYDYGKFDYILLSDCIFTISQVEPLLQTLVQLCSKGAPLPLPAAAAAAATMPRSVTVLLANERREPEGNRVAEAAFAKACAGVFEVVELPAAQLDPGYWSPDIYVRRLTLIAD